MAEIIIAIAIWCAIGSKAQQQDCRAKMMACVDQQGKLWSEAKSMKIYDCAKTISP